VKRRDRLLRLAQATMGLATNFDEVGATSQVVMNDHRDFSRPREDFYTSNAPADILSASDSSDPFVEGIQKFLKGKPLGVSYSGEVNGKADSNTLSSLNDLELRLQRKYPDKIIVGTIVKGNSISQDGFARAVKLLGGKSEEPVASIPVTNSDVVNVDDTIKQFQTYFGLTPTGVVDAALVSAAKTVEDKIAKITGNSAVKGLLWDDAHHKFNTTVFDVQSALKKIQDFESTKVGK
jgi:hypothetical protein